MPAFFVVVLLALAAPGTCGCGATIASSPHEALEHHRTATMRYDLLPHRPDEVDTGTPVPAWEMEGAKEVRTRVWAAARELKRRGAWLALGLRVEGERVRLLGVRAHEGTGAKVDAARAEDLRPLLEAALYHYVRGQRGEVVLTLRRGQGMWTEEALSTGPVLQASVPQAPYEAFLRNQGEKLRASAHRDHQDRSIVISEIGAS
jgi:hypothetical protein